RGALLQATFTDYRHRTPVPFCLSVTGVEVRKTSPQSAASSVSSSTVLSLPPKHISMKRSGRPDLRGSTPGSRLYAGARVRTPPSRSHVDLEGRESDSWQEIPGTAGGRRAGVARPWHRGRGGRAEGHADRHRNRYPVGLGVPA